MVGKPTAIHPSVSAHLYMEELRSDIGAGVGMLRQEVTRRSDALVIAPRPEPVASVAD